MTHTHSFKQRPWLTHTHSYVCHDPHTSYEGHDSHMLINTKAMTHPRVGKPWLTHIHLYQGHDSHMLIHTRDCHVHTTHSYVCHDAHICRGGCQSTQDSLICVSWLIHMCAMKEYEHMYSESSSTRAFQVHMFWKVLFGSKVWVSRVQTHF